MIKILITILITIILCLFVAWMLSKKWRAKNIILTRDVLRAIFRIVGQPKSETDLMRIMVRLKNPKEKQHRKEENK